MLKRGLLISFFIIQTLFIVQPSALHAKIRDIYRMEEILKEIDPHTAVFFDIDETLIITACTLGSTSWWDHCLHKFSKANIDRDKISIFFQPIIDKIIKEVPVKPVEEETPKIIHGLQRQNILAFGLTARSKTALQGMDLITNDHLQSVNINFDCFPSLKASEEISDFFAYGIIFTGYMPKGPFLKKFLENVDLHPSKIVFVDDRMSQLQSVEKAVIEQGLVFEGFHYKAAHEQCQNFDPLIGNIQLKALITLGIILSDEEAKACAEQLGDVDPDFYLHEIIRQAQEPHCLNTQR